jgi:hypothetical protein
MATVAQSIASISTHTGIHEPIVRQAARRLREDGELPNASGGYLPRVDAAQITLLLLASMATRNANSATRTALQYAALTYDGGAKPELDGGQPGTLHRHLAALLDSAWHSRRSLSFGELILDLSVPGAQTKLYATVDGKGISVNSNFVAPGEDAGAWSTQKVRQESRLPAQAFYAIVADLQRADAQPTPQYRHGARRGR